MRFLKGEPMTKHVFAAFMAILLSCGALLRDEPPFDFGSVVSEGKMARSAELKEILCDPPRVVYRVSYPNAGLKSTVVLDLVSRTPLEEKFEGRWRVTYGYGPQGKTLKIPSSINIISDREGLRGKIINRYEYGEIIPMKGVVYRDGKGRSRLIYFTYFDLMPGGPF